MLPGNSDALARRVANARPAWLVPAALLVAAVVLGYANTISVPFVYDDAPAILANPSIRRLSDIGAVLSPPAHLTTTGRPIVNLTLALDYAVGGTRVAVYHLTNLAIHLACGCLVFGLVRRTLTTRRLRSHFGPHARSLALVAAGLWLIHPLGTEAVTYVVQRAESLVACFYLFTLYAFARGSEEGSRPWLAMAVVACFAGMATKEVMVSAPLIVWAYDRTFLAGSWRAAWQRRRAWYVLLATSWFALALEMVATGGTRDGSAGFGQGVSSAAYALTQIPALGRYLWLSFWPHPLVFDYGNTLAAPSLAVLLVGLLIAAAAIAIEVGLARGAALGFVGLACAAVLAPSSSFVPVITETVAEHRMYLPLAGVMAAAVCLVFRVSGRPGVVAIALGSLALLCLTARRNADYATPESLWADTVAKAPENPRAHNQLGFQLADRGEAVAALAEYRAAIDVAPADPDARFNTATALLQSGRAAAALPEFAAAIRLRPDFADAHCNFALALAQSGRRDDAIHEYAAALRIDPHNATAHNNAGIVLAQLGRLAAATAQFAAAVRSRPDYAEAHNNLGRAYAETGRKRDAETEFRAALAIDPNYAEAHNNLALILDEAGRLKEAASEFAAVVRLAPRYAEAHYRLGNDWARLGRSSAAVREWQETLRLQPNHALAQAALSGHARLAHAAD